MERNSTSHDCLAGVSLKVQGPGECFFCLVKGWREIAMNWLFANIILLTGPLPPKSLLSRVMLHWVGGDAHSLPSWGYPIERRRQVIRGTCPLTVPSSICWSVCVREEHYLRESSLGDV